MEETSDLPEMQTRQPSLSPKRSSPIPITSAETAKRSAKIAKPSLVRSSGPPALGRASALNSSSARLNVSQNAANSLALVRRNSTGGIGGKRQVISSSVPKGKIASSNVEPRMRRSVTSGKQVSFGSTTTRQSNSSVSSSSDLKKQSPISPVSRTNFRMSKGDTTVSKQDTVRKATVVSTTKRMPSLSLDSHSGGGSSSSSTGSTLRKSGSKVSSPSVSSSGGSRFGSLSTSVDKGSSLLGRKKVADSRDSRLIMLPQVELKAGDDVRLDLRGHRVCSLNGSGLNLTPNLEFVYLRDNLLSSVEGIEVLKRVKVLDLSFNELKGPGFEPLENCKSLQQLYLAGNKITSLESLPQLPYLEFLSVAQNRLKSLSMATQPRLKVLAASKNKISTLKGFPHLPLLEHLRVEENPILEMPHVEAASILLIGPTLKRFNDRDLSGKEIDIAKRYPAHTFQCIRDGWEFCRPEAAVDSTFRFLLDKWKDDLPPGYILEEVSVDHPYEEDACHCHFNFSKDRTLSTDLELILNYQWFIGEKTPTNFLPIADAVGETYWPKREDIDKFLKVECTPILGEALYLSIFAVSSPVSAGTGFPKVLNLSVNGELVEGNVIKGSAEVAWCGGTPGKCVASWLRRRWNSTPVVVIGAEDEEYLLTLDDIDSSLVFMYTPVTEEGAKGEPQYAMTDFVKAAPPAVSNVQILGDIVEGNTIKGQGEYFGGKEGPSKFEWLRVNNDTG
ncbi:hypothetical protein GIB67_023822 [Kingdonia uniflora]|uniref:AIR9-like A9 domain-containing protein n=1 Tax=Kingdonia uniflora TaxID=39325 RepID=A0A7J7NGK2_9MAGN|nr:hypothetical protein GIB67_023822 [Kingdonia uniflora]